MFKVTFSDNRVIEVQASSMDAAKVKAYRLEPSFTITSVEPA